MNNILAFFQRLFSAKGQATLKTAWAELIVFVGMATALFSEIKLKDWGSVFQQSTAFYGALTILVLDVRNIFSSNDSAIKDPAVPAVTGTVDLPGTVNP